MRDRVVGSSQRELAHARCPIERGSSAHRPSRMQRKRWADPFVTHAYAMRDHGRMQCLSLKPFEGVANRCGDSRIHESLDPHWPDRRSNVVQAG
ncbi:hypothetical protein K4L06_18020 [Lysobacter sp. BMK333-48F3]|uniref:hypothetical protein n=1 Tax=Lysobacter sp. BMK333-48F3 TaxID=2867962 RepID=UPI001C8C3FA4|nr:hypothetical protein [Lysobacter sp. BMK333-48F3]MBX9403211.1 hypothetical protein [Lysobacter sp. BMK333-48F3]